MNYYKLFITTFLLIIIGFFSPGFSQYNVSIKRSAFKHQESGFDQAWSSLKLANKYYSEGPGSFSEALNHYKKALEYNNYNPELNYQIGLVMLQSDQKPGALHYFKKAYEFNPNVTPDIFFMLARALHYNQEFHDAISHYEKYLEGLKPRNAEAMRPLIEKYIYECLSGMDLVKNPLRVEIVNMGSNVNSAFDDYYPVVSASGNRIYFTSRRPATTGGKRAPFDNKYYEDIYFTFYENGWGRAQNIGSSVNTPKNDVALAITPDDMNLFVNYSGDGKGDILLSEYRKNRWRAPYAFLGKINSRKRESSFSVTADESTIYFVSERSRGSYGGRDIYFIEKNERGRWGKVQNIGPTINTEYDEEGVYIHPEGNKLYFSSKGHNSMGGYDIFYSEKDPNGTWMKPVNIGYPINTPDDDLFYSSTDSTHGYFSAIRTEGLGWFDLYRVNFLPPEEEEIIEEEIIPEPAVVDTVVVTVVDTVVVEVPSPPPVVAPIEEKPKTVLFEGKIIDKKSKEPVFGKMEILDIELGKVILTTFSDRNSGNFMISLPEWKDYGIEISARDYLFFIDVMKLTRMMPNDYFSFDFELDKIEVGTKVVLNNIFFETAKSTLTPASYKELDNVVRMLNETPTLRVEISGHTDNTGSLDLNMRLSQARAKSVVDYLIGRGIASNRLEYKGYGPQQPVAPNDTEAGRSQNRRVEFKVLGN
jgi:flagellar motor protein MotB